LKEKIKLEKYLFVHLGWPKETIYILFMVENFRKLTMFTKNANNGKESLEVYAKVTLQ